MLPIDHIVVDNITIPSNVLEAGSISHDVEEGTVSLTFLGVRKLEIVYVYMLEGKDPNEDA